MVGKQHLESFVALSDSEGMPHPGTWQNYLSERILASADYCNGNPTAMRLLLGPIYSHELRNYNVTTLLGVAETRVRALNHYFEMPVIDELTEKIALAIAVVDGIHALSYARHGKITHQDAEEAVRAAIAYMRCFLPEVIPIRSGNQSS